MKQFLLPAAKPEQGCDMGVSLEVTLDSKDTHYLKNVLRCRPGDVFTAADRDGNLWEAELSSFINKKALIKLLRIVDTGKNDTEKLPRIILYQSLLKGKKMDIVVRQAAEAGVSAIVPVVSEFSIVKIEDKDWETRIDRWNKICREALQQSGSRVFPDIFMPLELKQAAEKTKCEEKNISLFFHQEPIANKPLHQYLFSAPENISILIGPEGGFSDNETKYLQENNFLPAWLGRNVLRAETAAIYSIAAVKTILLERDKWTLTSDSTEKG
jgi:16S rRNA (uracil1498-N3)-methyltransferase